MQRVLRIERRASREALGIKVVVACWAATLASAFVLGHSLGPTALAPVEIAGVYGGLLILGLVLAPVAVRRRAGARALHRWTLFEGQTRREVVAFSDHLRVDDEIVLLDTVERAQVEGGVLVVRYRDPVAGGPLLREWAGKRSRPLADLDAVAAFLQGSLQAAEAESGSESK